LFNCFARAGRNLESGRKKQHNTSKEKGMTSLTRREALLFLAVACTSAQTVASERQWKSFLDWFSVLSPESFHTGPELMMLYRRKMLAAGMTATEADEVILNRRNETADPAFNQIFWKKHFERSDPQFRTGPNAFLVEVSSKLTAGKAQYLGMGDGRNAIYLAQKGWDVTGVDYAVTGVDKAPACAKPWPQAQCHRTRRRPV
jgi:hypothetical protein